MNTFLLFFKNNRHLLLAIVTIVVLLTATQALAASVTLDPTFGTNGIAIADLGSGSDSGRAIALQADGKIIMLGKAQDQTPILMRYNSNGSVDTSYGTGGQVSIGISACDFAVQSDGKVTVGVGRSNDLEKITLFRYLGTGALDSAFGTNGIATLSLGNDFQIWCKDIAIQSDHKIVVFGSEISGQSMHTDFFVARFNEDGSADTTFVAHGFNIIDNFPNGQFNYGQAVAIQPDGKIVLSGDMENDEGKGQISLARLKTDGFLDKTFGTDGNGMVTVDIPNFYLHKCFLAIQADGKLVVAGTASDWEDLHNDLVVVRFNSNGTLDTTFGGTGIATSDFGANEIGAGIDLQSDGRIIVVGTSSTSGSDNLLIVRYNKDGSLDNTFGDNGKLIGGLGVGSSSGEGIIVRPDGKFIVAGSSNGNAFLARYNAGGTTGTPVTVNYRSMGSFDGWVLESGENSNAGHTVDRTAVTFNVGDDQRNRQYLGILSFNTSSLPDNALITSAQVRIKKQAVRGSDPMLTHGDLLLDIRKDFFGNSLALLAGDFAAPASPGSLPDRFSNTTDDWYTANLSAANFDFISRVLTTQFRVRFNLDDNNNRVSDYVKFYSGNSAEANRPQLIVTYSITGGGTGNQAPVITSNGGETTADISLPENTTAVTTVTATDPDGQSLTYSIAGGPDAALFNINLSDGALSFVTAPSYNAPNDAGLDHVYNVTVQVSDGTLTDSQELVISILNPNPSPVSILDSTFGSNGVVTTKINGLPSSALEVLLQPDGKVITLSNVQSQRVITRYNSNGSVDTSFGSNGSALIQVPSFSGKKLALQPDGKLIVAGLSQGGFAVVRYNSNGILDTSFGTNGMGGGEAGPDDELTAEDVTVQPDGKIVMVGSYHFRPGNHIDFQIVRFNSDGTVDAINTIDWNDFPTGRFNWGKAVTIQPDNKIVMSGDMIIEDVDKNDISLTRLNPDLRTDRSTFGTNGHGTVITRLDYFQHSSGALALQADGRIVVAGTIFNRDMNVPQNLAMARFNSDGSLDATFGGTGIVVTDFGAEESTANLVIQANGKIILAGTTTSAGSSDFLLVRYNSDGSLDTSFGSNGKVVTDFGNSAETAAGIVQQPDGKVIVIGTSGENAILARYNTRVSGPATSLTFDSVGAHDGWILESGEFSNKGGSLDKTSNLLYVGDDAKDRQYRSILSFDTNPIPDDATVTSALVKIKKQSIVGTDPFNTHGNLLLEIRNGAFSNNVALTLDDFAAIANVGSTQDIFLAADAGWYTASLSNVNLGLINKVGVTQFRLLFRKDDNDDMGADYVKFFSGNAASDLPQLIVSYSTAGGGGTGNQAPVIYGGASLLISIPENTMIVAGVKALDPDGQPVTYSISGVDAGKFSINPTTGILAFLTAPDFEAIPSGTVYHVTAQASDGSLTSTQDISVTVTPVNEFAPVVVTSNGSGAVVNISLPENTMDVTTITATDADLPPQSIEFVFAGGADDSLFNFDPSTGKLSFVTAPSYNAPNDAGLDHVYNVKFEINDGEFVTKLELAISIINPNSAKGFAALNVSAHGPAITSSNVISVSENNTAVTTVTATDEDIPVQPLTYSITGGVDASRFNIDPSTGVLTFVSAPDFDVPADAGFDNIYNVTAQVSDGTLTATQDIAVTVTAINDNNPVITSNSSLSVAENTMTVITVTATDADLPVQTLTYSIVGGADSALFNINSSTGDLTFITAPDFEIPTDAGIDNIYSITVQASDGTLTATQDIVVTVTPINDNIPVITSANGFNIPENTSSVTTITAIDADLPAETFTYSITGGADSIRFNISASTGVLTFIAPPDFEIPTDVGLDNIYNVTVQASDGTLSATQDIAVTVIPVNDNTPIITSVDKLSMLENTSSVTTITATDADLPAETLTYSITDGADATHFNVNSSTGELIFIAPPDFEIPTDAGLDNIYNVTVQASDGTLSVTQDIAVTVTPVNDNTPIITSLDKFTVPENTSFVTTIIAADADLPAQTLTYSIAGGSDASRFSIDSSTGILTFITPPDFEAPIDMGLDNTYNVIVQASDGTLSRTEDLSVAVSPVNDNMPVMTSKRELSIPENATGVITITASDADLPAESLSFAIIGGADSARFSIDSSTGALAFNIAPDFESPNDMGLDNIYNVRVQVSDGVLVIAQDIIVTVTDVVD